MCCKAGLEPGASGISHFCALTSIPYTHLCFTRNTFERLHLFFFLHLCSCKEQNWVLKSDVMLNCSPMLPLQLNVLTVPLQQQGGRASVPWPGAWEWHNSHCFGLLFLKDCYLLEDATVVDFPSYPQRNKHAVENLSFGRCYGYEDLVCDWICAWIVSTSLV